MSKRTREDVTNLIQFAALIQQVRGTPEPDTPRPEHDTLQGLLDEAAYAILMAEKGHGPIAEALDRAQATISAEMPAKPRRKWQPPRHMLR